MRVFLTTDSVGGVWEYTFTLAAGLAAEGHRVLVAVVGEDGGRGTTEPPPGVDLEVVDAPLEWATDDPRALALGAERLARLCRIWGADVAHLNQMAYTGADFGAPRIVVAHSDVLSWLAEVRGALAAASWLRYRDWVVAGLGAADAVVAPTRYQSDLLARHYGRGADRVIHNGAAIPLLRTPSSEREPLLLAAGRAWDEGKGMDVLEAALLQMEPHAPPAHLFGSLESPAGFRFEPARLIAHGPSRAYELHGWMERAAIFVAPSRYEPFGLAPLEAALRCCSLVLSDIGSFRELWDGCATFVPRGDAAALAAAIHSLLGDPLHRERLARAARERALRSYGEERFVAEYLELYSGLLAGGPARSTTPNSASPDPCA